MSTLYLVRLPLSIPALGRWAALRNCGWTLHRGAKGEERDSGFDEGRALHHLLAETFGPQTMQPFRLFVAPQRMQGQVYAYSRADLAALRDVAQTCALPEVQEVCDLDRLAVKPMPVNWRAGRRLGFDVRVRPVSRLIKPLPYLGGSFAKGAELDTFLIEALRGFPSDSSPKETMLRAGRSREVVYTDWLTQRLAGTATLAPGVRLTCFQRHRAARSGLSVEGPDVTMQGNLTIDSPERFQELLRGGIGRHKAYGYGMILLRPPGMLPC